MPTTIITSTIIAIAAAGGLIIAIYKLKLARNESVLNRLGRTDKGEREKIKKEFQNKINEAERDLEEAKKQRLQAERDLDNVLKNRTNPTKLAARVPPPASLQDLTNTVKLVNELAKLAKSLEYFTDDDD